MILCIFCSYKFKTAFGLVNEAMRKHIDYFSSSTCSMSYYRIKSGNLIFYAKVEERLVEKRTIIQFGSAKFKDCLSIHMFGKSKIAELHGMIYNELCAINMPLPKGDGTIRMAKAALSFMTHINPRIQTVEITDNSQIDCGKNKVSLSDMYFATRGQTWYQAKLGAVPIFKKYDQIVDIMHKKPNLDFDDLWEQYLKDGLILYRYDKSYYEQKYKEAPSWFAFLRDWIEEEGCRPFIWLSDIPIGIMAVIAEANGMEGFETFYGTLWEITKSTIESYDQIQIQSSTQNAYPELEWREATLKKGGAMIFPEEVLYN